MSPKKRLTPAERAEREQERRLEIEGLLEELSEIADNSFILHSPISETEKQRADEIIAELHQYL